MDHLFSGGVLMPKAIKIILLVIGYCLYPLAAVIGYKSGVALFPVAFCFQTLLSMANFRFFEKKRFLLLFDALLVGDVILAHFVQTYLYTTRVSDDPMSYAIGMWGAEAGVVYVLLLSLVFFIAHWRKSRANSQNKDENI
jgi:hypothetical protein